MGLNPQYMLAPSLQEYFVDKDDGTPLAGGQVFFWQDNARNIPKPVYEISGIPPNYSYTVLPNPVTLSAVGTFQDGSGNDILPYYYPFDADGNVQLYYITVYDSNGVLQFTREGWPNYTLESTFSYDDITNFISNGQFLLNNAGSGAGLSTTTTANGSQTVSMLTYPGLGTVDIWQVAPGGWVYERTHASTATDIVSFVQNNIYSDNPSGSPRYSINIDRTNTSNDAIAQLSVRFMDVNKFQDQVVYLSFNAKCAAGTLPGINFNVLQYFGTGTNSPSNTNLQNLASFTLDTTATQRAYAIDFTQVALQTVGQNIGNYNTDFVEFCIQFPTTGMFNVTLTDFFLTLEPLTNNSLFPPATNETFVLGALANLAPTSNPENSQYYTQDGSNLYLPMIMTSAGFTYDYSQIGKVVSSFSTTPQNNELPLNGTNYLFGGYSALGIPYYRLGNYLITNSSVANTPMFGSGANFATAEVDSATVIYLVMNTSGGVTVPVSSSAAIVVGGSDPTYTLTFSSVPLTGAYVTFVTNPSSPTSYYVWYNTGSSTNPAPGGTGIVVNVVAGDTTTTVAAKTLLAINSYQFFLPDFRGYFIRSLGSGSGIDTDISTRVVPGLLTTGANVGSTELAAYLNHLHVISQPIQNSVDAAPSYQLIYTNNSGSGTGWYIITSPTTSGGNSPDKILQLNASTANSTTGGTETRPINFAVNYYIKY